MAAHSCVAVKHGLIDLTVSSNNACPLKNSSFGGFAIANQEAVMGGHFRLIPAQSWNRSPSIAETKITEAEIGSGGNL
jgi:hypothetical protein